MMSPEDTKKFETMINNGQFTQEAYDKLLKRFELVDTDLEAEYTKIIKKESNLSRRKRDLIPDFLAVRDMLAAKKKADEEKTNTDTNKMNTFSSDTADKIIEEKAKNI